MKFYVDGSGWNGKESKYAVMFEDGSNIVVTLKAKLTNNEAEYNAVITALQVARKGDVIYTDSELVVKQLKGEYAVKADNLKQLHDAAKKLQQLKGVSVEWIKREENKAGALLEK